MNKKFLSIIVCLIIIIPISIYILTKQCHMLKDKYDFHMEYNKYWSLNLPYTNEKVDILNDIGGICADGYSCTKLIYSDESINLVNNRKDLISKNSEIERFFNKFIKDVYNSQYSNKFDYIINLFNGFNDNTKYIYKQKNKHKILIVSNPNSNYIFVLQKV